MAVSLEQLKETFFQQMGSVALFDAQGRYVGVNRGWMERYSAENGDLSGLIGHDVLEFVPNSLVHDVIRTRKPISGMRFLTESNSRQMLFANYLPLFDGDELIGVVMYSIFNDSREAGRFYADLQQIRSQFEYLQDEVSQIQKTKYNIDSITGTSKAIRELKASIIKAASTPSVVLIEGETGSGKELVAHAIHDLSARKDGPFVQLNCTTIPANLAESELFGYEAGSFTGASRNGKIGKFEAANGGSIFLDEINSLPLEIQPKLLRVLQEKEVEHVGSIHSIPIDARVIAATNASLLEMVENGAFRRDLYYRLNVINIKVPSLRERKEDIPIITASLIRTLNRSLGTEIEQISDEALELFSVYDWPGNIRELRNVLERAMNWKSKGVLWPEDFFGYFANHSALPIANYAGRGDEYVPYAQFRYREAMDYFEKKYLIETLTQFQGNKKAAAEHVGLSRAMFYRKLEKYGIK